MQPINLSKWAMYHVAHLQEASEEAAAAGGGCQAALGVASTAALQRIGELLQDNASERGAKALAQLHSRLAVLLSAPSE